MYQNCKSLNADKYCIQPGFWYGVSRTPRNVSHTEGCRDEQRDKRS